MSEVQNTHEIRARREQGFWRAGRHFTKGWEPYNQADFTEEEWERITKERQLEVRPLAKEETEGGDPAPGGDAPPAETGESDPEPSGDDPPVLEATLKDGRPRCQHVYDTGSQCTYAAAEGSAYCERHQAEHPEEAQE